MSGELTSQKSYKERWQEHLAMTSVDLRGLLIEAVAQHEGWEESAIALVDEAIMPVIAHYHKATGSIEYLWATLSPDDACHIYDELNLSVDEVRQACGNEAGDYYRDWLCRRIP